MYNTIMYALLGKKLYNLLMMKVEYKVRFYD